MTTFKEGDEVWVKAKVVSTLKGEAQRVAVGSVYVCDDENGWTYWPRSQDTVRTDADFISERQKAVIKAAVSYVAEQNALMVAASTNADNKLKRVVKEMQDAQKPKTAEEVLIDALNPTGSITTNLHLLKGIAALRSAGLLRESL